MRPNKLVEPQWQVALEDARLQQKDCEDQHGTELVGSDNLHHRGTRSGYMYSVKRVALGAIHYEVGLVRLEEHLQLDMALGAQDERAGQLLAIGALP